MRKKKNLAPRLAACAELAPQGVRPGKWRDAFGEGNGDRALSLEIGCGKGRFIVGAAAAEPDALFVAMERAPEAAVMAMEKVRDAGLGNVRFIVGDAAFIGGAFADGELDRIYLNFSDPWTPKRQAKRRLTYRAFLALYARALKEGGELRFKSDNRRLFEFTVCELSRFGWVITDVSADLHKNESPICERGETPRPNVMTEYEEKFSSRGFPIYLITAVRPDDLSVFDGVGDTLGVMERRFNPNGRGGEDNG